MKLSVPMKRDIQTAEGIAVYTASVLVVVLPLLPHTISWTHSVLFLTILQGVNAISRRGLKAVASLNNALGIPSQPGVQPVQVIQEPPS